jgi:hypothetical protein
MGGFQLSTIDDKSRLADLEETTPVTSRELKECRDDGCVDVSLQKRDIKDKDKVDSFTKMIAVLQISWLVLSVLTRAVQHLASSQLEVVTLAFAACAVPTYFVRWNKPKDVREPTIVGLSQPLSNAMINQVLEHPIRFMAVLKLDPPSKRGQRIKNDNIARSRWGGELWKDARTPHVFFDLLTLASVVIGCIHLMAWNFEFPTLTERTSWRIASLVSVGVPLIPLLAIVIDTRRPRYEDNDKNVSRFIGACLTAMKAFAAMKASDLSGNDVLPSSESIDILESALASKKHYREVFQRWDAELCDEFLAYIKKNRRQLFVYRRFPKDFARLLVVIGDPLSNRPRFSEEAGSTDVFPAVKKEDRDYGRGPLMLILLYASGIIYILSRLMIIALALSCLRAMPDTVYVTTWARYIPYI